MSDYDRGALDYVGALTDAELGEFLGAARKPSQLTAEDVSRMYAARDYDGIVAAQAAGRLDEMIGVPTEQTELIARARRFGPVSRADLQQLQRMGHNDLVAGYAGHVDQITD